MDAPTPLTAAQLEALDAKYTLFPPFSKWPQELAAPGYWEDACTKFESVSAEASTEELSRAQEIALRTAAFDTGAIEGLYATDRGLTFTVATQVATWEQDVTDRGENALELFRAQLDAFELVLDEATRRFPKMTQAWVRELHEATTAAQETYDALTPAGMQKLPLPKGEYKKLPNHVMTATGDVHAYAPVDQTQSEMQRLIDELDTDEFKAAHPIVQASYCHYGIAAIHPFADGNGRVARAVSSAYTYRVASVPLVIHAHQREEYLDALARADVGEPSEFIEFIARTSIDGLQLVTDSIRTARSTQPAKVLDRFREMYVVQGGLSHEDIDALANTFIDDVIAAFANRCAALSVPDSVAIEWIGGSGGGHHGEMPKGFRSVVNSGHRYVQLELTAAAPGQAKVHIQLDVFVATGNDTSATLLLRSSAPQEVAIFGLNDLQPQLASAARIRLENFVQRILGSALEVLLAQSQKKLEQSGYRR